MTSLERQHDSLSLLPPSDGLHGAGDGLLQDSLCEDHLDFADAALDDLSPESADAVILVEGDLIGNDGDAHDFFPNKISMVCYRVGIRSYLVPGLASCQQPAQTLTRATLPPNLTISQYHCLAHSKYIRAIPSRIPKRRQKHSGPSLGISATSRLPAEVPGGWA